MRKDKSRFVFFISVFGLGLVMGMFQNCSRSELKFEDLSLTQAYSSLNYRYISKPSVYVEALLALDPDPNPEKAFKVKVLLGRPADFENQGVLRINVVDENDRLLCPRKTLDLSRDFSMSTLSCVPPSDFTTAILKVSVEGTRGDYNFSQSYSF
ncbi:MAG TPA: hypothetical protein DCL41_10450 [Bdellovibrionales bacterium]|nr:hypothetical protein [Pseudobdellovibrionaceae bacterium]HAG92285.1 hypothetical protein [Bdellovibrionales bacterium]|tara:strand:+ start:1179 stop:1640 length:462 start_codon:yes stop_codon:yes gene_type:complete